MESVQPSPLPESQKSTEQKVALSGPQLTLLDQSMEKLSIESKKDPIKHSDKDTSQFMNQFNFSQENKENVDPSFKKT